MNRGSERGRAGHAAVRWAAFLAFAFLLGLPLALRRPAQGVPGEEPRDLPTRKLVVISMHADTIKREFERAFSRWTAEGHGFITKIEWLDVGGTLDAIRYVDDAFERNPQGVDIDVFFGGGTDPFLHFGQAGLLRQCSVPQDVLDRIPQTYAGMELYDAERRWFGACLSGFGVLYNKAVLEFLGLPEPQTWTDLGQGKYFSWISSGDPRKSGSMHMVYEIIFQAYGWEKGWEAAVRIGANCRGFAREASSVPWQVFAGEAACGMAIDTYAFPAVAEAGEDRMGFRLPEHLTVVSPDGIGVLKGAPNLEVAELFVQFVLSEAGQKLWILRPGVPGGPERFALYRSPVIPGLVKEYARDSMVKLDAFDFEGGVKFDPAKMNARWRILNDLFGACVIDTQDELAAAWKKLRVAPEDDPRRRELLRPPVSEQELFDMAGTRWGDPYFRAETIARWSAEARAVYRRLAEGS